MSLDNDAFGNRMKNYESVSDYILPSRMPVILRLDGNSFSKLTKKLNLYKPIDARFSTAMAIAAIEVMHYCSGSVIAYVQSDEITVLLKNDQNLNTNPFLANRIQKICSLVASVCSVEFACSTTHDDKLLFAGAHFDCRCFVVPESEINNVFLWRQLDAFKNYVSSVAYYGLKTKYGKKTAMSMLDNKNTSQRQEIIFQELGSNIDDHAIMHKRGVCIYKQNYQVKLEHIMDNETIKKLNKDSNELVIRSNMHIDTEIPKFSADKEYIMRHWNKQDERISE